jgi:tryptophanyl-tRNA synthetase
MTTNTPPTDTKPAPLRVLSGVQPSGILHLGNYFGAMKQHIDAQHAAAATGGDVRDVFIFIADLHALTTVHDPANLRTFVRNVALDYLALGLDPEKVTFYRQSDIPYHTELSWILSCVTGMGLLERAHSYKDKTAKGITASVGLFTYPVLMAADILLYRADVVPVGPDQRQHLEMTRDMAKSFNDRYGPTFPIPRETMVASVHVPGTDGEKMSKSYHNTINLFDDEAELKRVIMKKIVTDSKGVDEPKDPNCTVFTLYKLVDPAGAAEIEPQFTTGGVGYGDIKKRLLAATIERFAPARAERARLEADPAHVDAVLARGAEKAQAVADSVMADVRLKTGLR